MAHITSKSYYNLQKRLNDSAQGAPESDALFKILEVLFSEEEAKQVSILPLHFFTIKDASQIWEKSENHTRKILNTLADKGILIDFQNKKTRAFILAPTMAGFFEFSLMRTDGKFDRKILSELYYQYLNQEHDFVKDVLSIEPAIGRAFIQEDTIQPKDEILVLDYERVSKVIENSSCIALGTCFCRHKMEHLGKACKNPQDVCLSFNYGAETIIKHGIGRKISKKKAYEILNKCIGLGLVQLGDNIQDSVNWVCNCCECCCDALNTYKRLGYNPNIRTNFVSKNQESKCRGCDICVEKCPVYAIKIHKDDNGKTYAKVDSHKCIGCGVCTRFCPTKSLKMYTRKERQFVPKDSFERCILEAINTGKLQNFIFDNYTLWTHDILRRLVKIILTLKPMKQILALRQIRSRFMNAIVKTKHYDLFNKLYNKDNRPDYSHSELKGKYQAPK